MSLPARWRERGKGDEDRQTSGSVASIEVPAAGVNFSVTTSAEWFMEGQTALEDVVSVKRHYCHV